jgi:hypothetical protein
VLSHIIIEKINLAYKRTEGMVHKKSTTIYYWSKPTLHTAPAVLLDLLHHVEHGVVEFHKYKSFL